MSELTVEVTDNSIHCCQNAHLPTGATDLTASISFNDTWESLTKTVTFRCGNLEYTSLVSSTGIYTIPHELLVTANIGLMLDIGITGTIDDDEVYPTTYCHCGIIEEGCEGEADPSTEATPTYYQQVLTLATKAKSTLNAATATTTTLAAGSSATVDIDVDYDTETLDFNFGIPKEAMEWGNITGSISNQADLQAKFNAIQEITAAEVETAWNEV